MRFILLKIVPEITTTLYLGRCPDLPRYPDNKAEWAARISSSDPVADFLKKLTKISHHDKKQDCKTVDDRSKSEQPKKYLLIYSITR